MIGVLRSPSQDSNHLDDHFHQMVMLCLKKFSIPCFLSFFFFSALAWLAGVVSLNDLRLSANLPGDNFKSAVAGDGKIERFYKGNGRRGHAFT